ncbi:hypothetical protein CHELA1G11_20878 [Hyphomicrobiales bacterium]|nr:hypothetical protein CHELA1G11_20878 [Hyphomicrobiales bacterium]
MRSPSYPPYSSPALIGTVNVSGRPIWLCDIRVIGARAHTTKAKSPHFGDLNAAQQSSESIAPTKQKLKRSISFCIESAPIGRQFELASIGSAGISNGGVGMGDGKIASAGKQIEHLRAESESEMCFPGNVDRPEPKCVERRGLALHFPVCRQL